MHEQIEQALSVLRQGGIIIYPTDTAFGIGCRMDDELAIKRLFTIRKRPVQQATPQLVDSLDMARRYWNAIPAAVTEQLIQKYWPGALTIILPCDTTKIPEMIRENDTLGLRMPNNETALQLISGLGVPLLGPSANFHGEATPYYYGDLDPDLVKLVDYVLPGECSIKQASTVIDCSREPWRIVREGAVRV
jgi:L-threonylcarbamoyladenylate synthase